MKRISPELSETLAATSYTHLPKDSFSHLPHAFCSCPPPDSWTQPGFATAQTFLLCEVISGEKLYIAKAQH